MDRRKEEKVGKTERRQVSRKGEEKKVGTEKGVETSKIEEGRKKE